MDFNDDFDFTLSLGERYPRAQPPIGTPLSSPSPSTYFPVDITSDTDQKGSLRDHPADPGTQLQRYDRALSQHMQANYYFSQYLQTMNHLYAGWGGSPLMLGGTSEAMDPIGGGRPIVGRPPETAGNNRKKSEKISYSTRVCKFCKNNGELAEQYTSHVLRHKGTGLLICPVLRAHVCEYCGATGDHAHTRNYCPALKKEQRLQMALPVYLKKTARQSDGQFRKK